MTAQELIDAVQPVLDGLTAPLDYVLACPQSIDAAIQAPTAPTAARVHVCVVPTPPNSLRVRFAGQDVTVTKS